MKYLYGFSLIGALALAGAAYAQQPPDAVNSDTYQNTAMGTGALPNLTAGWNPLGNGNTAAGFQALYSNTGGSYNTATGSQALAANTSGISNTATGDGALLSNTTGNANTGFGSAALENNTTGLGNAASGTAALYYNTTGNENTATGYGALQYNSTGNYNTATGMAAISANTTGGNNTASGYQALYKNTTGSNNIADGFQAGYYLTAGSNNIDIGNSGVAGDNGIIRIGTKGTHKSVLIAGVYGTSVSGSAVVVSSNGKLGVTVSSERFKTAIAPMVANSEKLQQLRPVTFHLKTDPKGALQYGLIAEEVAEVYPDLVIRDDRGRIDGVRYDELAPMLLNEVQQQAAEIRELKQQQKQFATQTEVKDLQRQLQAALLKLHVEDKLVAQR